MKRAQGIGLQDVQDLYEGPQGDLWELIMGEQIHIGGFGSSMALADQAGIRAGQRGVDLCCCNGAGMRFLVRFREVASMVGVDATKRTIETGRSRCQKEGLADRIRFVHADACESGLPPAEADFVWGEDAWCYVTDKPRLIAEAARIARPGGVIAFTDWVEGPKPLSESEAEQLLGFMKFANILDLEAYPRLLEEQGCEVLVAEDTGIFGSCIDLYREMIDRQLTYDALRIVGFDTAVLEAISRSMAFLSGLAHAGKVAQGRFVARRR